MYVFDGTRWTHLHQHIASYIATSKHDKTHEYIPILQPWLFELNYSLFSYFTSLVAI